MSVKITYNELKDIYGEVEYLCREYKLHDSVDNSFNFHFLERKIPHDEYTLCEGATKAVILSDKFFPKWVIKIPFEDCCLDYCGIETHFFEKAEKEGLSSMFAPTFFIGKIHGMMVYVQQRVHCDVKENWNRECEYTRQKLLEEMSENEFDENLVMSETEDMDEIERLKFYFGGVPKLNELIDFLETNEIYDFHSGNIGFLEGEPILFDYSGYSEQ